MTDITLEFRGRASELAFDFRDYETLEMLCVQAVIEARDDVEICADPAKDVPEDVQQDMLTYQTHVERLLTKILYLRAMLAAKDEEEPDDAAPTTH